MKNPRYLSLVFIFSLLLSGLAPAQDIPWQKGRFAYVTNEGDDTLQILDLETETTAATLKTGKVPHALVFDNDGKGYVNNRGDQTLTVIDGNRFQVLKTLKLPATSFQLAMSPDNKTLAVGYKDALLVSFIDTETDTIIKSVPIGEAPEGTKTKRMKHPFWSKDGNFLYVGDNVNHTVVKLDGKTYRVAATIPVPGTVHHLAVTTDGKQLYVAHEENKIGGTSVSIIDTASDKMIKSIPIPLAEGEEGKGHHGAFDLSGRYFYHCNEGGKTVSIIDTQAMQVVKTLQTGMGAGHAYFAKDGRFAYIIPHKDNVVTVIDVLKHEVTGGIEAGKGKKLAHSAQFMSGDKYLYVVNAVDSLVAKIDLAQQQVVSTLPVGKKPLIMVVR